MKLLRRALVTLWLVIVSASAYAETPVIFIVRSPLTGEQNALTAIARELHGKIEYVDSEALELQNDVPDLILHALAVPNEIEDIFNYKRQHPRVQVINLGDPIIERSKFDFILNATHLERVPGKNVIPFEGVPSQVTTAALKTAAVLPLTSTHHTGPVVAVMIGGKSKGAFFTENHARALARNLNVIRDKTGARFLISNSRRTGQAETLSFLTELRRHHDSESNDVIIDYRGKDKSAPSYLEILANANYLVVTGDSMSMIADALITGKPTYIFAPPGSLEERHKAFILEQAKHGRLRPLSTTLENYTYRAPDAASDISKQIRTRLRLTTPPTIRTCSSLFE